MLYLDVNDFGQNAAEYGLNKRPDRIVNAKGMNNHFVRLEGLIPNKTYYFLVKDSEGTSERMFFTTAPNKPDQRIAIVAGGDSRNHREARRDANLLVAKLRPLCVMFGGDFTESSTPNEWKEWMEDWQLSIAKDGRITPIIVTRGNHEENNQVLDELFDLRFPQAFYALNIGGSLLRLYTLNTLIPVGGEQRDWLEADLKSATNTWKIAQYHFPMRPHTKRKAEKNDQVALWAPLFLKYNMDLVVECDAHVVKSTWPIVPSNGPGSMEGFIRDDENGTVYVGEGCWGAPLRENNDDKTWTRASGSFNEFNWIFIDREKIEVRTVKTDGAQRVADIDPTNVFSAPRGLMLWGPPTGDVITIAAKTNENLPPSEEGFATRGGQPQPNTDKPNVRQAAPAHEPDETADWEVCPLVVTDAASGEATIKYHLASEGNVVIRVINTKLQEVTRIELQKQPAKEYLKSLKMSHLPAGKYLAIVKLDRQVVRRFRLMKK